MIYFKCFLGGLYSNPSRSILVARGSQMCSVKVVLIVQFSRGTIIRELMYNLIVLFFVFMKLDRSGILLRLTGAPCIVPISLLHSTPSTSMVVTRLHHINPQVYHQLHQNYSVDIQIHLLINQTKMISS